MPLSAIQKGAIGQFAFLAAALVTGRGQLEVYTPAADNEGRDAEVRRHLRRAASIGIQIKVAFGLRQMTGHRGRTYLALRFVIPEKRVRNDPRLWYFVAVYDPRQLRFLDPTFLIPSAVMHRLGRYGRVKRGIQFEVVANLLLTSRDKWSPYRVLLRDLGKRLLEIIDDGSLMAEVGTLPLPEGAIVIGRARRRAARPKRNRIARAA
jgi:alpha-D-ribose 1-methylphosphonate 5-phosphate C-P lyase